MLILYLYTFFSRRKKSLKYYLKILKDVEYTGIQFKAKIRKKCFYKTRSSALGINVAKLDKIN